MTQPSASALADRVAAAVARVQALDPGARVPGQPAPLSATAAARMIDHTLLKPDAQAEQIRALCAEAEAHGFASVCVNPTWVPLCAELLDGAAVAVCSVVGFPLGAMRTKAKAYETADVLAAGATEIDMVINVGLLKDQAYEAVYGDVAEVAQAAHNGGAILKVILETCLLTDTEKIASSVLCQAAGADFIKTSTGFNGPGANLADVALMRAAVGPEMGVKAAGGVRTGLDAAMMVAAGATRIGASAGVRIVQDLAGAPAAEEEPTHGERY